MPEIVFWETEYPENTVASNMGFDAAKIVLRYNGVFEEWQTDYYTKIHGQWYEAEQHEIIDICVNFTIKKIKTFLESEEFKTKTLDTAKRSMLSAVTLEPGEKENAA